VAEGILSGILGDDEPAEEFSFEASIGAESLAMAHVMDQARADPDIARQTSKFLAEQTRLVKLQARHLPQEQRLRLALMRQQSQEATFKGIGQRVRVGMQVLIALVAIVLGLGFASMLYDAFTSHSVVVDAFQAPSGLVSRGLTGDVVAARVLDALQKLQDATRGVSKGLETKSAWSSDIRIEVPETGVSIGEINRLLHARFGRDLHIDGDLVQTADGGLALTVRGDGVPAKTFAGDANDLDALTVQGAEYVYGRSQPYQYAVYLYQSGRAADAVAFITGAYARAPEDQRFDFANLWANAYLAQGIPSKAAEKRRLALSLKPRAWNAWGNLVADLAPLSEEASWREGRAMMSAVSAAPSAARPSVIYLINWAGMSQDWKLALASNLADAARNNGAGTEGAIDGPAIADDYAYLHDAAKAEQYLTASDPDDPYTKTEAALLTGTWALERGDAAAAIPPLETFWRAWLASPTLQTSTYWEQPCRLGLAYGLVGRLADAQAVFKRAGRWAYCYAVHGDVLERAGDFAAAERVWAEGIGIGPDLSPVYLHRGISETKRGALRAALADLAAAHARSPHWADPLKAWGDALLRAGNHKAAIAKYNEALQYAPAWVALRQARDTAARKS
jgi:tetratricopeptide (TPR) repeat protein